MASPAGKISMDDVKHWLYLLMIVVLSGVVDIVANQVIPALKESGSSNAIIVMALTLGLDMLRRWLTNTNNISKTEDKTMVVKDDFLGKIFKKLGMK